MTSSAAPADLVGAYTENGPLRGMVEPSPFEGRFYTVSGGTHRSSATGRADVELDVVVERLEQVADGVAAVTLREPAGRALPAWGPGAHLDLILPDGRFTQYSLCGDPRDHYSYRLGVLRGDQSDSISRSVHALEAGTTIAMRGPRNHFALVPAPSYVFLAGGIGITPILPMVRRAEAAGIPWTLLYVGRTRSSMAFLDELAGFDERVVIWARDEQETRADVTALVRRAPSKALLYCCGPQSLIDAVEEVGQRWAPGRVRAERFATGPVAHDDDTAIEVRCDLSDVTLNVPPGTSILQAADAAGISTVSSCGKGICGTCETVVLEGTPDHRDAVLDDEERAEGDTMMTCVSRALGPRLVLDL